MDIKIEALEPGIRFEELLHLFQTNFKTWPDFSISCSQSEYYRWKYLDNINGLGFITVGLDRDTIIGCIHGVRARCKIGNQSCETTYGSDALIDKAYRKRGIFPKLSESFIDLAEQEGSQLHYVSTHLEAMTRSPRVKIMPFNATNLVHIKDMKLHAKHMDTSFMKRTGYFLMKLLKEKKRKQANDLSYDLVTNQEFIDPGFWMKIKDYYDFIIERDTDYLNWRYIDCPDKGYYVRQAVQDGKLLGYVVCKINDVNKEYPSGNILDLLALPKRRDVVDILVGSAVDYFDDKDINIISISMVEGHDYKGILGGHGFVDTMHGNYLNYYPYVPSIEQELLGIKDNNRACFHYGDTDYN